MPHFGQSSITSDSPLTDLHCIPAFTYSRLINGLSLAGITINRKVLADLAVHQPEAFNAIAAQAKSALPAA